MFFDVLTLFPSVFTAVTEVSIVKRAIEKEIVSVHVDDIRSYTTDRHRTVDDYPYGGDAGMLLMPIPLGKALEAALERNSTRSNTVVYMSAQGEQLSHKRIVEFTSQESIIIVCGHYKGIDQRIIDKYVDVEVSVGDYVVSGGEVPAMILIDAITRLLPGVLGNYDSAQGDSFFNGILGPPHYTRPEVYEGVSVPKVLLSGHHEEIRKFQYAEALELTKKRRPDLFEAHVRGQH